MQIDCSFSIKDFSLTSLAIEHKTTARKLILRVDKMLDPEGKNLERTEERVNEVRKLGSRVGT